MTITDDFTELAEHVEREVHEAMRMPTLDAMRALLNESGIRRARVALAEAPDRLATAQTTYREAQAAEALAKEAHAGALLEAEWDLDGRFQTDGNKTYLRITCEGCEGIVIPGAGDKCGACDGIGSTRKQMTADERKAWKASESAKAAGVVTLAAELYRAQENTAAARDAVNVAEKRLSASKYEVQAAIAELNALSIALQARGER